ncbi:helix-turn-helix domain-containing protein [Xanthomonas sp. NCPPB 3005]|uniref:helix-turn-helix domain-containing protein n=1 Tax=Xanthomonas sp. NCPPB 3005 TaxID=3240913 RepID=UPI003514D272
MVFDRYPVGGGEMLLALAIADHAHDDGTHIFPSIAHLARKTRQSERSVQYQLRRMEASGWLILVNDGIGGRRRGRDEGGRTRQYRINPEWMKGADIAPLPDAAVEHPKGADFSPLKGANDDGKGCKPAQERVQNDAEKGAKLLHPNLKQPKATLIEPHSNGAAEPRAVCGTSPGPIAASLNRAAMASGRSHQRITSQHPDLIAAAAEGVTAEHLIELADMYPDKPAGYLIAAARRQHAAGATAIAPGGTPHAVPRESASERTRRLATAAVQREAAAGDAGRGAAFDGLDRDAVDSDV